MARSPDCATGQSHVTSGASRVSARATYLVSYAVNIFKQNRIPDSGAAFFEMVAEPAL